MHIPQTTPTPTIAPITGVDLGLHRFIGLSWHVLMPYTLFGACLVIYSQTRLALGERAYKKQVNAGLVKNKRRARA
jgi:hypothetical protein